MSIAETIASMETNLGNAYTSCASKSATIPTNKNLANLASCIDTITGGGSVTLSSIAVTQIGTTSYEEDDTFSLTGYTITATYSNGTTADVTNYCTFTPSGALATTDTSVTISYMEAGVTKTTTQAITVVSQVINYTMVYDLGDEKTAVTGGWDVGWTYQTNNGATGQKNASNIYVYSPQGAQSAYGFETLNTVNITDYKKLNYIANPSSVYGQGFGFWVYAIIHRATWHNDVNLYGIAYELQQISKTVYSYDISSATGNRYLGFASYGQGGVYMHNAFLTKQDNWQQLCTVAGLTSSSYADENALCNNATAMATILGNQQAVNYMIYNCTGSFMAEFIVSSVALTALNNSTYKTTIQANTHWNKFLNMVA